MTPGLTLAQMPLSNALSARWYNKLEANLGARAIILYLAVWSFGRWRQRHGSRRHTALFEKSLRSGGSAQYEYPHLLRFDRKRVRNIAWQEDHCPWRGLDRPIANGKGQLAFSR